MLNCGRRPESENACGPRNRDGCHPVARETSNARLRAAFALHRPEFLDALGAAAKRKDLRPLPRGEAPFTAGCRPNTHRGPILSHRFVYRLLEGWGLSNTTAARWPQSIHPCRSFLVDLFAIQKPVHQPVIPMRSCRLLADRGGEKSTTATCMAGLRQRQRRRDTFACGRSWKEGASPAHGGWTGLGPRASAEERAWPFCWWIFRRTPGAWSGTHSRKDSLTYPMPLTQSQTGAIIWVSRRYTSNRVLKSFREARDRHGLDMATFDIADLDRLAECASALLDGIRARVARLTEATGRIRITHP